MLGERFGKLVVMQALDKTTKGRSKFVVKCDCGNEKVVFDYNLKNGHTTSCGCVRGQKRAEQLRLDVGLASKKILYRRYKDSARLRNLSFDLDFLWFIKLTSSNCYYCGGEPNRSVAHVRNNGAYLYNGIDRIDNNEGYELNNVVPCCFTCNRAKGNMSYDEYKNWIIKTYNNMESKNV